LQILTLPIWTSHSATAFTFGDDRRDDDDEPRGYDDSLGRQIAFVLGVAAIEAGGQLVRTPISDYRRNVCVETVGGQRYSREAAPFGCPTLAAVHLGRDGKRVPWLVQGGVSQLVPQAAILADTETAAVPLSELGDLIGGAKDRVSDVYPLNAVYVEDSRTRLGLLWAQQGSAGQHVLLHDPHNDKALSLFMPLHIASHAHMERGLADGWGGRPHSLPPRSGKDYVSMTVEQALQHLERVRWDPTSVAPAQPMIGKLLTAVGHRLPVEARRVLNTIAR